MDVDEGAPFFLNSGDERDSHKKDAAAVMAKVVETNTAAAAVGAGPKTHYQTSPFSYPERTLALGVDRQGGNFALALRHTSTTREVNPIMYIYMMWCKQERSAFYSRVKRGLEARPDQLDIEIARLKLLRTIDSVLREPIDRLLPQLEAKPRQESPAVPIENMAVMPRTQPARNFECDYVELAAVAATPPPPEAPAGEWNLLVASVPRKAPRRPDQLPGWKEVAGVEWQVHEECVPVVVFNATQVIAFYEHRNPEIGLVMDCSTLACHPNTKKWSLSPIWICKAPAPERPGNCVAYLSPQGTLAWAMANAVWVKDNGGDNHTHAASVFKFEPHVLIVSLTLCDATHTLTVGTQHGEVLSFNWKTAADDSLDILLTPFEEPVLAVHRDATTGGRNMALTISSVCGRLTPGSHQFKSLEMERPVAMTAAGDRVVVMNKYGKVEVYFPGTADTVMRGLLEIQKNPPPVFQMAWPGLWASPGGEEIVAQMHNGVIHFWE